MVSIRPLYRWLAGHVNLCAYVLLDSNYLRITQYSYRLAGVTWFKLSGYGYQGTGEQICHLESQQLLLLPASSSLT